LFTLPIPLAIASPIGGGVVQEKKEEEEEPIKRAHITCTVHTLKEGEEEKPL